MVTIVPHSHFFSIKADTPVEFGFRLGTTLRQATQARLKVNRQRPLWRTERQRAKDLLNITRQYFPQYIDELKAYAEGAKVNFFDIWTVSLEDEVAEEADRCTTVITNQGQLLIHNEDWYPDTDDLVWVLHKRIGDQRTLELYYVGTLGGNAVSTNSNGFTIAVNSLSHKYRRLGVPRNVIARWLSETKDPVADYKRLQKIPRSRGYNFNIVSRVGKIWNIELTSRQSKLIRPAPPFVHTNHYLSKLKKYERNDNATGTWERYAAARSLIKPQMPIAAAKKITADRSAGAVKSIMNERTIARMIVDFRPAEAHIWLRREAERGWVKYDNGNG